MRVGGESGEAQGENMNLLTFLGGWLDNRLDMHLDFTGDLMTPDWSVDDGDPVLRPECKAATLTPIAIVLRKVAFFALTVGLPADVRSTSAPKNFAVSRLTAPSVAMPDVRNGPCVMPRNWRSLDAVRPDPSSELHSTEGST